MIFLYVCAFANIIVVVAVSIFILHFVVFCFVLFGLLFAIPRCTCHGLYSNKVVSGISCQYYAYLWPFLFQDMPFLLVTMKLMLYGHT